MLTASCMHLHHLSLTSDLTKPLGIGFKDTKRTFWLIHSCGEKAALLFSETAINTDQKFLRNMEASTFKAFNLTREKRNCVSNNKRVQTCDMVRKQRGHLLRMNYSTIMFLHIQSTEHNLSDICGHTDKHERKVNHVAEQDWQHLWAVSDESDRDTQCNDFL